MPRFFFDGDRLREAIDQADATHQSVAEAVGLQRSSVTKWMKGETATDLERAKKVASFLGVPLESLRRQQGNAAEHVDGVVLVPGFPIVRDAPEVFDVVGPEHVDSIRQLERLYHQARAYCKAVADLLEERQGEIMRRLRSGAQAARGVRAEIVTDVRRSSSWKPVAATLAASTVTCQNCATSTPVCPEGAEEWIEKQKQMMPTREERKLVLREE